jgi:hypothetical protein
MGKPKESKKKDKKEKKHKHKKVSNTKGEEGTIRLLTAASYSP